MQSPITIVGAGPVGLTLSLLLKKIKIPFLLLEKNDHLTNHPSAHYINMRSMEIFSEINDMDKKIYNDSDELEHFRYYRYMKRLLSSNNHFGITDQFYPSMQDKFQEIMQKSYRIPSHLPQHRLVQLLYDELLTNLNDHQSKINFNQEFESISSNDENADHVKIIVRDTKTNKLNEIKSSFVIACDGFHSKVRRAIDVRMIGQLKLQHFLNIYFTSKSLAQKILARKENAMLHFIYNPKIIAVLVNHSYNRGEFVLQVPLYPSVQSHANYDEEVCKEIINKCLDQQEQLNKNEINIEQYGFWNLSGVVAEQYYKNRVILAGDSAHSFPPAGGFGMNTGVQDAYNLAFKLAKLLGKNQDQKAVKDILDQYSCQRKSIAEVNLSTAMKFYGNSIRIADYLGLKVEHLNLFKGFMESIPFLSSQVKTSVFGYGLTAGSMHLDFINTKLSRRVIGIDKDHTIPLIFYDNEVGFQNMDKNYDDIVLSNNLKGRLIPHANIQKTSENNEIISIRQLAYRILLYRLNHEKPNPTEFLIALTFNSDNETKNDNTHKEIIKKIHSHKQFIQSEIIIVKITKNGLNVLLDINQNINDNYKLVTAYNDILHKFEYPQNRHIILVDPDSTIIGTLKD